MKVQKVFLVACREEMIGNKTVFLSVYGTTARGEMKFAICSSDVEDLLKDEYPNQIAFERAHNEPEWFDDLDDLSDELEAFPWTRGTLYYSLSEYEGQIGYLVDRTQASEGDAWAGFGH